MASAEENLITGGEFSVQQCAPSEHSSRGSAHNEQLQADLTLYGGEEPANEYAPFLRLYEDAKRSKYMKEGRAAAIREALNSKQIAEATFAPAICKQSRRLIPSTREGRIARQLLREATSGQAAIAREEASAREDLLLRYRSCPRIDSRSLCISRDDSGRYAGPVRGWDERFVRYMVSKHVRRVTDNRGADAAFRPVTNARGGAPLDAETAMRASQRLYQDAAGRSAALEAKRDAADKASRVDPATFAPYGEPRSKARGSQMSERDSLERSLGRVTVAMKRRDALRVEAEGELSFVPEISATSRAISQRLGAARVPLYVTPSSAREVSSEEAVPLGTKSPLLRASRVGCSSASGCCVGGAQMKRKAAHSEKVAADTERVFDAFQARQTRHLEKASRHRDQLLAKKEYDEMCECTGKPEISYVSEILFQNAIAAGRPAGTMSMPGLAPVVAQVPATPPATVSVKSRGRTKSSGADMFNHPAPGVYRDDFNWPADHAAVQYKCDTAIDKATVEAARVEAARRSGAIYHTLGVLSPAAAQTAPSSTDAWHSASTSQAYPSTVAPPKPPSNPAQTSAVVSDAVQAAERFLSSVK